MQPGGQALRPGSLNAGAKVQAVDPRGYLGWYDTRVISTVGKGKRARVRVRFVGFSSSQDVEVHGGDLGALRTRLPRHELHVEQEASLWGSTACQFDDGTWTVESIEAERAFLFCGGSAGIRPP